MDNTYKIKLYRAAGSEVVSMHYLQSRSGDAAPAIRNSIEYQMRAAVAKEVAGVLYNDEVCLPDDLKLQPTAFREAMEYFGSADVAEAWFVWILYDVEFFLTRPKNWAMVASIAEYLIKSGDASLNIRKSA